MTRVAELLPQGIPLDELVAGERDGLPAVTRCGHAVLVLTTAGMTKPRVLQKTTTHDVVPVSAPSSSYFVVPVKKSDGSPGAIIRVGRAASNDVVIADVTLSKLHAFFREKDGTFLLEDGGSKNGTFVAETQVAARGSGPPTPVPSGSELRFGSIRLRFMLGADLQRLIAAERNGA